MKSTHTQHSCGDGKENNLVQQYRFVDHRNHVQRRLWASIVLRSDGLVLRSGALHSVAQWRTSEIQLYCMWRTGTTQWANNVSYACLPLPKNLYYNSVSIKVGLGRTIDDDTTQIITTVESHSVQWYKISLVSSAKKIRIFFGGSPYCDSVSVDLLNVQYVFYHVFNSALCPLFFQNLVYTWRRTFFWQFLAEK